MKTPIITKTSESTRKLITLQRPISMEPVPSSLGPSPMFEPGILQIKVGVSETDGETLGNRVHYTAILRPAEPSSPEVAIWSGSDPEHDTNEMPDAVRAVAAELLAALDRSEESTAGAEHTLVLERRYAIEGAGTVISDEGSKFTPARMSIAWHYSSLRTVGDKYAISLYPATGGPRSRDWVGFSTYGFTPDTPNWARDAAEQCQTEVRSRLAAG